MTNILAKHLPLRSNSSRGQNLQEERKKDHYSHFILRLAFSSTEDLRRRFSRLETALFRLRFKSDDLKERKEWVSTLNLEWEEVGDAEKAEISKQLAAAGNMKKEDDQEWFKVDWERVPELVDQRRVFLKRGKAYVPQKEQLSLVVAEFTKRLDEALEVRLLLSWSEIYTDNHSAYCPCASSSRRRRPPRPYPRASLPILHSTRRSLHILRCLHRRALNHNIRRHRLPRNQFPALHAIAAQQAARRFASQALRPSTIHTLPQRHRS